MPTWWCTSCPIRCRSRVAPSTRGNQTQIIIMMIMIAMPLVRRPETAPRPTTRPAATARRRATRGRSASTRKLPSWSGAMSRPFSNSDSASGKESCGKPTTTSTRRIGSDPTISFWRRLRARKRNNHHLWMPTPMPMPTSASTRTPPRSCLSRGTSKRPGRPPNCSAPLRRRRSSISTRTCWKTLRGPPPSIPPFTNKFTGAGSSTAAKTILKPKLKPKLKTKTKPKTQTRIGTNLSETTRTTRSYRTAEACGGIPRTPMAKTTTTTTTTTSTTTTTVKPRATIRTPATPRRAPTEIFDRCCRGSRWNRPPKRRRRVRTEIHPRNRPLRMP
mmetsp:Transcript_1586/g.3386  ORF Transcript_1586/g.3386 Transcript_1586/m.3386 type:complete len:331 (-) Transcript_1586:627-1619(-)